MFLAALALAAQLELRTSPFVDLHFWVRHLAEQKEEIAQPKPVLDAVALAAVLDRDLGGPLGWGPIEGLFGDCKTAADALAAVAALPESLELRPGQPVELRARARRLVEALAIAEPVFLEKVWPEHRASIEAARKKIDETFSPKSEACLAYVAEHLGLTPPDRAIPVLLVCEGPFPGAVTQRDDAGRGVCFVAVQAAEGTQLFECILHEATHALDLATKSGSVLDDLRARLEEAGFTRRERLWRDVPHTLMFVQAGETIRRLVDPHHEHYGVVARYYDKVRAVADLELPVWIDHLDGKASRAEAVAKIAAGAAEARKPR
jgi:hypothetical protein